MPEGPEVYCIGKWLDAHIFRDSHVDRSIADVQVLSGRYARHGADFIPQLAGFKFRAVRTHGKMLWFDRTGTDAPCLCFTFGMSASFRTDVTKHARVKFTLDDGLVLYWVDPRNFGTIRVLSRAVLNRVLRSRGFDACKFSATELMIRLSTSLANKYGRKSLAELLMDQRVLAGIGNYCKSEILWHARLSPHAIAGKLTPAEIATLAHAIRRVLDRSIAHGGATMSDYALPDGTMGRYSKLFSVYRCSSDPDGNTVVREMTRDGRSTYWAPNRQLLSPL